MNGSAVGNSSGGLVVNFGSRIVECRQSVGIFCNNLGPLGLANVLPFVPQNPPSMSLRLRVFPQFLIAGLLLTSRCWAQAAVQGPFLLDVRAEDNAQISSRADEAVSAPIVSLMDRKRASPISDPHEYVSYATYWWPDPLKPDGRPFIRKDGHHNTQQTKQGDRDILDEFYGNVRSLSVGWAVLHKDVYAQRAGAWLRTWLIAPGTRMSPDLEYSQVQLGHNGDHGAGTGVLDGRDFATVVDCIRLLHGSSALSAAEEATVQDWFKQYLHWLLTSANGDYEHVHPNNHGSWFLVQAATIARFCGEDDIAHTLCLEDCARIDHQFQPDGSQPEELLREDAIGYSVFNLSAQFKIVQLAAPLGIDLAHYVSPQGGSLRKGLDYLKPYSARPETWKGNAVHPPRAGFIDASFKQAAALGI